MTTPQTAGLDATWADEARRVRQAAELLGWRELPRCLPDEQDACGGGFAQHTASYYLVLCVIADHQLHHHICMPHDQQERIYTDAHDELATACGHTAPGDSSCCKDTGDESFDAFLTGRYTSSPMRVTYTYTEDDLRAAYDAGRASVPWAPGA